MPKSISALAIVAKWISLFYTNPANTSSTAYFTWYPSTRRAADLHPDIPASSGEGYVHTLGPSGASYDITMHSLHEKVPHGGQEAKPTTPSPR